MMSSVGFFSGSLCNLRNTLVRTRSLALLELGTFGSYGKIHDKGKWELQFLSTKIEARNKKVESSKPCKIKLELLDGTVRRRSRPNANKSELHEFKAIQQCEVQQKIIDGKDLAGSVTVLVFDIETTGFSRDKDRIIELAVQDLDGGENSTFQTLVNPGRYVPNADIHGISTHMVNRFDVPRMKDLVPILLQYVQSRRKPGGQVLWVAHNGRRFDVPFLIKEFSRCSAEIPPDWLFVDTLALARLLQNPDGTKLSSLTLESLGKYYEIPLNGKAHRAMADVNMLSLVLQKITVELKLPVSGLLEKSFKASDLT